MHDRPGSLLVCLRLFTKRHLADQMAITARRLAADQSAALSNSVLPLSGRQAGLAAVMEP